MRAGTLLRYLFGDLDAARTIASDPSRAIGIGLLFVCSAMIAREYDGEYLPGEPIHIALPFLGGLGGAFASGTLLYGVARFRRGVMPSYGTMLARWTALFLWTAPLAWLYAIPWDRFLSEHDAAVANMVVLGVVATWRVGLSVHVGSMLFGASPRHVSAVLLGVGAPLAAFGLFQQMLPLLATMGGGRLPVATQVAANVSSTLLIPAAFLALLMPVLGIATVFDKTESWNAAALDPPTPMRGGPLVIALVAIVFGVPMLAIGQREQRIAHAVMLAIRNDDAPAAIDALADHTPDELPPHWTPVPGRFRWGRAPTSLLDLLDAADVRPDAAPWARTLWVRELAWSSFEQAREVDDGRRFLRRVAVLTDEDLESLGPARRHLDAQVGWWPDEHWTLRGRVPLSDAEREELAIARRRLGVPSPRASEP